MDWEIFRIQMLNDFESKETAGSKRNYNNVAWNLMGTQ